MASESRWVALVRDLYSVSIDPLTNRETRRGFLPTGTLIEDPEGALRDAVSRNLELVLVRSRDKGGWIGLERVEREALRRAVPQPPPQPPPR